MFAISFKICTALVGSQQITLLEFAALLYIGVPLSVSFLASWAVKSYGPLVLGGVKGARRKNT